jgi:protein unc-45
VKALLELLLYQLPASTRIAALKPSTRPKNSCRTARRARIPRFEHQRVLYRLNYISAVSMEKQVKSVDFLKIFKDAISSKNERVVVYAVEGLAFSSTAAATKDVLSKDAEFLSSIIAIPNPPVAHILYIRLSRHKYQSYNLQILPHRRTDTRGRNSTSCERSAVDELDDDVHVTARCKAILAAGLLPALNAMAMNSSPACITAIAYILSLATSPPYRGLLAHQGVIKLILGLLSKPIDQQIEITLSHALAKILISVNPTLIFSSRTPRMAFATPLL